MHYMKKRYFYCGVILSLFYFLVACNSNYTSKKTGYYKIGLPEHKYVAFNNPSFPYSFEYPEYAAIIQDSSYFDSTPENSYWINVDFPTLHARVFLSYKIIGGKALYKTKQANGKYKDSIGINQFDRMVKDAFNLTNKNDNLTTNNLIDYTGFYLFNVFIVYIIFSL